MPTIEKKRRTFLLLLVIAGLVIVLSAIAIAVTLDGLRNDAIRGAEQDCAANALLVGDQLGHAVQAIDRLLNDLRKRTIERGIASPEEFERQISTEASFRTLQDWRERFSHAAIIFATNTAGELVATSRLWPAPRENFADREYFITARDTAEPVLHMTGPLPSRTIGDRMVFFSKRMTGVDGAFVGVVVIAVELDYINRIYDRYSSLAGRVVIVSRTDGIIIAYRPELSEFAGRSMPKDTAWYDTVAAGGGSYRTPGRLTAGDKIVSVYPVAGTPLVVTVAMSEDDALAMWRRRAISIGIGTAVAVLCALGLLLALGRQFRRVLESRASLIEREAHLKEKSDEILRVNMRLDAALNNMSHGLCMFDKDNRLQVCNDRYLSMYRLSRHVVEPGMSLRALMQERIAAGTSTDDPNAYAAKILRISSETRQSHFSIELSDQRIVSVRIDRMADGGWVALHEDITERTRAEQRITHMARHDALTGLANRMFFHERMGEAFARLDADGRRFAVLIFDIDLFKSVNDSLGHTGGDALLEQVAERARASVGPHDTVGRIGGDEFAVIQVAEGNRTAEGDPRVAAADLAGRLLGQIRTPYEIDGQRVAIGISVGIALAPADGIEPSQLLKNADLALYRAKSDGRGCFRFFEPAMDADARLHRTFEFELREALARDEFELHYQPIVDVVTRRPCAVEALVRWRHPRHGLIPPDKFIPVAEEIGLIIPLGEWILKTACATAAAWPDDVRLAVNLSAVQFRSGNLPEVVRGALDASGLPAARLELEITESVLLQKDQGGLAVLHELAGLGARIVLDDFGTGYSSLSYLQMFPFSKIKIDKSFVAELSSRADCAAIVCTVINLAKALDMTTTAEGVETVEQLTLLRAAGCREAQGWLFGRPAPADQLVLEPAPMPTRLRAAV